MSARTGETLRFQKGTALGNDYIVIDAADLPCELTPARARRLCDRHIGIGSDGILLADLSNGIALRIINPDGSEAEKSGNGLRIFGAYLHRRGVVAGESFDVRLPKDTVSMQVEEVLPNGALSIRVAMGTARFTPADIGLHVENADAPYEIHFPDGAGATIVPVSVGNPHSVVFVSSLNRADFLARAPQLCTHPSFANGTNVQFARVIDGNTIEAWIWERGAGETQASGSSASAVAAAAVRRGLVEPGTVQIRMPGGTAEVGVTAEYAVTLRGPAEILYEGVLSESLLADFVGGA